MKFIIAHKIPRIYEIKNFCYVRKNALARSPTRIDFPLSHCLGNKCAKRNTVLESTLRCPGHPTPARKVPSPAKSVETVNI